MNHPIRCRCGKLQGHLVRSAGATRALCYCKDCQAYARFLGSPGIVDEAGGTEVVASVPARVHFSAGLDSLACMSLSPRGILRWYASCCNTPIGNTARNPALPYVGLVHSCLEQGPPSLESSFGPLRVAVNTTSARGPVRSARIGTLTGMIKLLGSVAAARLGGAYKINPFFVSGTREPIRPVRVLSEAERQRVYRQDA